MNTIVTIPYKIDYALLAKQKNALLNNPFGDTDEGQGILHLIDQIQDDAVENGIPEDVVYPHRSEEQPEEMPATLSFEELKQKGYSWDGSGIGNDSPNLYKWYYAAGFYYPALADYPMPEPTTNAQTNLIEAQIALLLEMAENPDLSVNDVSWINDDLDFIEVAYKRNAPDGDRQQEYFDEIQKGETQYIDFKEAMFLLHTRITNSI